MDKNLEKFIAAFEAAGHVPVRDDDGDVIAEEEFEDDGYYGHHPLVRCSKCCYVVCWMCVTYHGHPIDPCEN